jgi:hypothetical protein
MRGKQAAVDSSLINSFTASCENAMSVSVPGVPAPCEDFPHDFGAEPRCHLFATSAGKRVNAMFTYMWKVLEHT